MTAPSVEPAFRWGLVLPLAVAQLVSWGSLYYAFAVVAGPMASELGWSKPEVTLAVSIGLAVTGVVSFQAGRAIDRYGGHLLMTSGSVAACGLLLAWSIVTELWQLYAIWAALGATFSAVLYEPVFAVMARELKADYRRGIVVVTLLGGFASTVFIPLTHGLVESVGWRQALQVLALLQLPFGIAIHGFALRERSRASAAVVAPDVPVVATPDRMRLVMRNPVFWLLSLSYCAYAFMFTALTFHILPLLVERGLSMGSAVLAYSLVGPSQVAGRIVVFALEKRIDVRLAGIVATMLPVGGLIALMLVTPGSALLYVFAVLYGAGMGIKTIVQATAAPELLGREGYGALQGALSAQFYVVQAATPFAAALMWSAAGNYGPVLLAILAAATLSAIAFVLAIVIAPRSAEPPIANVP